MEQLEPHTILTGSRSDGKMIDVIEAYCTCADTGYEVFDRS